MQGGAQPWLGGAQARKHDGGEGVGRRLDRRRDTGELCELTQLLDREGRLCSTPRRPRIQNKQISLSPEDRDLPHRRRAQRLRPLADREVHRPLSPPGQQKREKN